MQTGRTPHVLETLKFKTPDTIDGEAYRLHGPFWQYARLSLLGTSAP